MRTNSYMATGNHYLITFWYFVRRHRAHGATLVGAILGYWGAAVIVESPRLLFGLSVGITVAATIVIVTWESKGRDFVWLSMRGRADGERWIGQGGLVYARSDGGYRITQSHDGVILSDTLAWSDYRLQFMFRIEVTSVGVIVRATNLGNVVMLQIMADRVKAHIRVNGAWLVWDNLPHLTFPAALHLGQWFHCEIMCDKRSVRLVFSGQGVNCTLNWVIPAGNVVFGAGGPVASGALPVPFAVNYDYGAIGFRNDGAESALVRHVLVELL